MAERVKQAMDYCRKYDQAHLVDYLKPVFSKKSDQLAKQILQADFKQIAALFNSLVQLHPNQEPVQEEILTPIKSFDEGTASESQKESMAALGLDAIRHGEVAVITMAGGQGTRLGLQGPKGTLVLATDPPKSLFAIQCEQLLKRHAETGVFIPWLIMTSEENHAATEAYFKEHGFFGYDSSKVRFFPQEMIPIIDFDGKAIVNEDGLATGPNGNGGIFSSLSKSGEVQRLKEQGVRRVFICGIDNALVKVADPLFVGFSIQEGASIACKSTLKRHSSEKAGVFCYKNGKPSYVEYTEISPGQAKSKDENGDYLFGDIGIVMYMYRMDILDKTASVPLPYHIAKKATPYVLPDGEKIRPSQPNSIKFETFIFDSFQIVDDIAVLRVPRQEEFAPVKNKEGEDSPQTAARLYEAQQHQPS